MKFFLKLKHWQIFTMIFGLPILLRIAFILTFFTSQSGLLEVDPYLNILSFFALILSTLVFFFWLWSVGIELKRKIPSQYQFKNTKFIIAFWSIFMIIFIVFIRFVVAFGTDIFNQDLMSFSFLILFAYVLFLFSIILIPLSYCIYFAAKIIATLELNKKLKFSEFLNEFFLLLFFPIGIWVIQPKINALVEK